MSRKIILILVAVLTILVEHYAFGQTIARTIDVETGQVVPYVRASKVGQGAPIISGPNGHLSIGRAGTYTFSHPFYRTTKISLDPNDSITSVELERKPEIQVDSLQLHRGDSIIEKFHEYITSTSTFHLPEFEYLSYLKFDIYQQARNAEDKWVLQNSLESIEKNRFKFPDKRYARVVSARFNDGDSSKRGFLTINNYSVSHRTEYINAVDNKYYNPIFSGAGRRYDYALVDIITGTADSIYVVFFKPKKNKRFLGLTGVLYFSSDRCANLGGLMFPDNERLRNFSITFEMHKTSKNTYFARDLHAVVFLNDIPNLRRKTKIDFSSRYTLPNFDTENRSNKKWVNMAIFDHSLDSIEDDTWLMNQEDDDQRLEYIKKDTVDQGFVLSESLKQLYNIYDGRLGYRMRFFDINNVFAINRFESVRIGLGLQSHENFSDMVTFGGYVGYGFRDGKFKYGGNIGIYLGATRRSLLSFKYKRDLLEPGLVHYMDKREDLVRNFFTSRMDGYESGQISIRTRINAYITSNLLFTNYSLKPLYDYIFNPYNEEITESQVFNFTESSLLLTIGTPLSDNPSFREILYRKKRIRSNLFVNLTRGWITDLGGQFEYIRVNGRLSSNIRIGKQNELDLVLDGGVMTPNQPYQINYGGPGTEFKLTGIIINNAFQTMQLYGFFSDRYAHSFINYNFGNIITKKSKFKPELALALNLGWGKLKGSKEIHENIEVRDYPQGYFEGGILFNNLLRLKIYNYFYGGLGIGTFVGYGPDAEKGAFAVRLSYEIGTL